MSLAILSSCVKEEEKLEATAIMTDIASLEFGIDEELTKALTVYADAPWTVDCPEWITVDPATGGAGEVLVSVIASPNIREQLPDRPRKSVIVFRGQDMYADASVDVLQDGDKYRDLVDGTLAEAFAQKVETFVGVKDVQVIALAEEGYVVKDENDIAYVAGEQEVEIGDKGSVYAYVSTVSGLPALADADKFVKSENAAVDYSGVKDITATLQSYFPEKPELVSIKGKYASKKIELYYEEGQERPSEPDSVRVELLNPHSSLSVSEYDGWLVEVKGYAFGNVGNVLYVVPVSIEGIKAIEKIYFSDDFSWLSPWSVLDAVGKDDQTTGVTNVWKASWADEFFAGFKEKGYKYLWATLGDTEFKPGPELVANGGVGKDGSLYVCKDYLKFGQSSYNAAIVLPALSAIEGEVNIKIDFDWCWQVTKEQKPDIMTVSVESNVGKFETGTLVSRQLQSAQSTVEGESHLAWQHASVILTGATAETVLTIRPTNADPSKSNAARKQNRWYLDNIKVIKYEGSVSVAEPTEAEMTISMENTMTFEAAQTEPVSFEFVSDQEAVLTAGADWMYFLGADDAQLSSLTIPAATTTTVKVGCLENTKSESRKTEITIESGLSKETIPVTQVSPGVKLEPFISLVGGNSGKVSFDEGSFNIAVQTNVEYEISPDAGWVTVEEVPETRALVDVKQYVVTYQANTEPVERTAHIRAFNAEKNLETVYTLVQDAFVTGVYFQDDFTWVAQWADAYGSGDSVGDNDHSGKAPNVYTHETQAGFLDEFAKRGYVDLNPDGKVIYTQKYYLKFGKTDVHTGITLPQNDFEGDTPVDVDITFDWCAHMITKEPYTYDKVQMVVELTGPGVCADSKEKVSNAYDTKQTDGHMEWQKFSVRLNGVTKDTRISIRPLNWDKTSADDAVYKVQRYHVDNIKVEKAEGSSEETGSVLASFPFPYDKTFTGTEEGAGTKWNLSEGWLLSEDGKSKLSSHNPDGSSLKFTYKYEAAASDGTKDHVRVLATGMKKGGYWLFEVPVADMPAGSYNIKYKQSSSNTGANYFLIEVSVDGQNWTPVDSKTSSETYKDGTEPRDVTYTYALNKLGANIANLAYDVDVTYNAPALPGNNTLYIKATVADDMEYRATKAIGDSGTNRIWGPCEITFTKN